MGTVLRGQRAPVRHNTTVAPHTHTSTTCTNASWVKAPSISQIHTPPSDNSTSRLSARWWIKSWKLSPYNRSGRVSKLLQNSPGTGDKGHFYSAILSAFQGLHVCKWEQAKLTRRFIKTFTRTSQSVWVITLGEMLKSYTRRPLPTLKRHHLKAGWHSHPSPPVVLL